MTCSVNPERQKQLKAHVSQDKAITLRKMLKQQGRIWTVSQAKETCFTGPLEMKAIDFGEAYWV